MFGAPWLAAFCGLRAMPFAHADVDYIDAPDVLTSPLCCKGVAVDIFALLLLGRGNALDVLAPRGYPLPKVDF